MVLKQQLLLDHPKFNYYKVAMPHNFKPKIFLAQIMGKFSKDISMLLFLVVIYSEQVLTISFHWWWVLILEQLDQLLIKLSIKHLLLILKITIISVTMHQHLVPQSIYKLESIITWKLIMSIGRDLVSSKFQYKYQIQIHH